MRDIINKLNIPEEMSIILRTAGGDKSKLEIKETMIIFLNFGKK